MIEEQRPIPLEHHYLVGDRLHPMHVREHGALVPNPYVVALDREEVRYRSRGRAATGVGARRGPRFRAAA